MFFVIVPHQKSYIVQYLGKYRKTLGPGFHFILPFIQRVRYRLSHKEIVHQLQHQSAVTKDNVIIHLDGVLYYKIKDPLKAAYGARHPVDFTKNLTQSLMRSQIGKLTLDQTFEERDRINHNIMTSIQIATQNWGIQCTRYQIKDILLPQKIKNIMNKQAEAQRNKRSVIIQSQGKRTANLNVADAKKRSLIMVAEGQGEAMLLEAKAIAERLDLLRKMHGAEGDKGLKFRIARLYLDMLKSLKKKDFIFKKSVEDPEKIVKQSLKLIKND